MVQLLHKLHATRDTARSWGCTAPAIVQRDPMHGTHQEETSRQGQGSGTRVYRRMHARAQSHRGTVPNALVGIISLTVRQAPQMKASGRHAGGHA